MLHILKTYRVVGIFIIIPSFLLSVCNAGNFTSKTSKERTGRIVNGHTATPHEFPFMVVVGTKSAKPLLCGGSIVNNMTIITAAHCVMNENAPPFSILHFIFTPTPNYSVKNPSELVIIAGEHNLRIFDGSEQYRNVTQILVHPSYRGNRDAYDLALLKLAAPLKFNKNVKEVPLAPPGFLPIGFGTIVGWGHSDRGGESSSVLRKGSIPLIPELVCRLSYSDFRIFSNICAGGTTQDTCFGDSGGPLLCSDPPVLCGITSYGSGCGRILRPGAYTKVAYFYDWILKNSFHPEPNSNNNRSTNL